MSRPTRIISPDRKVWASPRKAIAAMHQATKSSPVDRLTPIGRPAESTIIRMKIKTIKPPAA